MSLVETGDLIGLTIGTQGRRLLSLIEALNVPFGFERSVKLGDGAINEDRFLAILHKSSLGDDPAPRLAWLARKLSMPDAMVALLLARLGEAEIVQFGYEGGKAGVFKIYLEFSAAVRAARLVDPARAEPVLVHYAVKWRPDEPETAAVSSYVWPVEARGAVAIDQRLVQNYGGLPSAVAARAMVERARRRCQDHQVFFLEVSEGGSARRSFDVNVYAAGLQVLDMERPLRWLAEAYGITRHGIDDLLGRLGPASLGHLSGGVGRNGKDFATLYFGVVGRKGTGRDHA